MTGMTGMTGMTPSGAASQSGALDARVVLCREEFALDVNLTAEPGEVVAVLGPNGAGKSTLLGILAGTVVPDSGRVELSGTTLTDARITVPPERRRVGLMGQDPLLFPHLSAAENIAFGPRAQGVGRRRARAAAGEWLDRMDLAGLGARRPSALSGGQRQRVALARALAAEPELLLLDEPLGALDASVAPAIRQLLRRRLRESGTTTILVTHDVIDAATLADRVVVLADGAVVESGPAAQVLAAPRSPFTAALAGVNLMPGDVVSPAAVGEYTTLSVGPLQVSGVARESIRSGGRALALCRPSAVAVYAKPAVGSPRNTWPATITALEPGLVSVRVRARLAGTEHTDGNGVIPDRHDGEPAIFGEAATTEIIAELTAAAVAELRLAPGSRVYLSVKATEIRIHPLFAG